mmetsp:Transcript_17822/g.28955  ORF Transcript_17822/g.28955 Transcript_17822/m.28955 type:complete len:80 (+) Transcript_17822:84-323(+)
MAPEHMAMELAKAIWESLSWLEKRPPPKVCWQTKLGEGMGLEITWLKLERRLEGSHNLTIMLTLEFLLTRAQGPIMRFQ